MQPVGCPRRDIPVRLLTCSARDPDRIMSASEPNGLDPATVEDAAREFEALGPHLPREALAGLAREVVSRMAERRPARQSDLPPTDAQEIDTLVRLLFSQTSEPATAFVHTLLKRGVTVDQLYLTYLSGAAARLGTLWNENRVSFTDVTIGVSRIYGLLRAMRPALSPSDSTQPQAAIFANVPGEDHTLGVTMAADLFRRNGWEIELKLGLPHDQLMSEIQRSDTRFVGISVSSPGSMPALARLVLALRVARPDLFILIGGRLAREDPGALEPLGADAVAWEVAVAMQRMRLTDDPDNRA